MDAFTLDGLIGELRGALVGAHVTRVRASGPEAMALELSRPRRSRVWLDSSRHTAGVLLVDAGQGGALEALAGDPSGRARSFLLLARKHLRGCRITALRRIAGERIVVLETTGASLLLRVSGAAALTLARDGAALESIGAGRPVWPVPDEKPEHEWGAVDDRELQQALSGREDDAAAARRRVLALCSSLGPDLAREMVHRGETAFLRAALLHPRPHVQTGSGVDPAVLDDAEVAVEAPVLTPVALSSVPGTARPFASWQSAAASWLTARRRGVAFEAARRLRIDEARRERRRWDRLLAHLEGDVAGLTEPATLRRQAEALLALAEPLPPGPPQVTVPDPARDGATLTIAVEPSLGSRANADRLFARARRVERARLEVSERQAQARAARERASAREQEARDARRIEDLGSGPALPGRARKAAEGAGPRRYLTSAGLALLVGRSSRENHELTFSVAGPDDLWLHAREVRGAHVILLDPEGRSRPDDVREGAEVAAFFSEASGEGAVDVHVARRKHLRPGRGAGRVQVTHSETVRVRPRDPEGRLRRR